MLAVEGDDRPHGDARGLHVDQQEGNPTLLLGLGVGADQAKHPVGVVGVGGPGFLAIDHVVLAIAHCAGFQAGKVGAGTRFRVTLAPPVFAAENARQKTRFLLGGTELDDHRGNHLDAERHNARRAGGPALFFEDVLLYDTPARATDLGRPTQGQPALLVEGLHPLHLMLFAQTLAMLDTLGKLGGQPLLEKPSHLLTEGQFVGREFNIHQQLRKPV
ncbi:hypothetical protein D3C85_821910 [compost metagenome]